MTFNPEDFLVLARDLNARSADEATLRTVISRAYYSVFLTARSRLAAPGAGHIETWKAVQKVDRPMGDLGNEFRRIRNAADYGEPVPRLEERADYFLLAAGRLLEYFK